jgi:hypothetical protein
MSDDLFQVVSALESMLVAWATGGSADDDDYQELRKRLLSDETIGPMLPRYVKTCRDLSQFWSFIKVKYPTYEERRQYIWKSFRPIFDKLEGRSSSPIDHAMSDMLTDLDVDHVEQNWQRALNRRFEDPEAAITSARTLLESTCKVILDELGKDYTNRDNLPKLYRRVAESLNLAPDQHTEQVFQQILGGCQTVVEGLGAVRNKLSDAHGKGKRPVRPDHRHAELAVNLAGTMAVFLVRTWEKHQEDL